VERGVHLFGSKSVKKKRVMQADQPINLRPGGGVKGRSFGPRLDSALVGTGTASATTAVPFRRWISGFPPAWRTSRFRLLCEDSGFKV